ncbi:MULTISPECIES: hypothetical protein [Marinobacter]|uniref:Uncharacterized protein n=1 Tax=Marinobacter xestospongiae TaxID=994319 RepID=A0ABU3VTE3_9GAMM|nr:MULTISPECIES: hypothetical protein [Marinobacter]MCG8519034.1 hypothetical protein [Pseudomonadales bacterium]MDV2077420.1 hypothetical protein [Marinobacter xestospongiae]UDL04246.1 hypothetical protein J2887_16300 [Marinobacter sp. CA1]
MGFLKVVLAVFTANVLTLLALFGASMLFAGSAISNASDWLSSGKATSNVTAITPDIVVHDTPPPKQDPYAPLRTYTAQRSMLIANAREECEYWITQHEREANSRNKAFRNNACLRHRQLVEGE